MPKGHISKYRGNHSNICLVIVYCAQNDYAKLVNNSEGNKSKFKQELNLKVRFYYNFASICLST